MFGVVKLSKAVIVIIENMSEKGKKVIKLTPTTLIHESGLRFRVNLTNYELQQATNDQEFASELIKKYYTMYQKELVTPDETVHANSIQMPSTASNVEETEDYGMIEQDCEEEQRDDVLRTFLTADDEELLISLVAQRPPLYDMRLPLKERSREIVAQLWKEVIEQLNLNIPVADVSSRWKNIRDSYMRARSNINKKIATGSSAEEKRKAEIIKRKHKHYEQLEFLNDTLVTRSTTSNVISPDVNETAESPTNSSTVQATPTANRSKRKSESSVTDVDKMFFQKLDTLAASGASTQTLTATQHFCLRLADSLERLPRRIRSKLEIEFLQKIAYAEDQCLIDE